MTPPRPYPPNNSPHPQGLIMKIPDADMECEDAEGPILQAALAVGYEGQTKELKAAVVSGYRGSKVPSQKAKSGVQNTGKSHNRQIRIQRWEKRQPDPTQRKTKVAGQFTG